MSNFFINRPIVAIVISILTLLIGVVVIKGLSIEQYPFLAPPNIRVTATYPGASAEAVRPWILAPIASPPRGTFNRGRMVCTCNDVSESEIQAALRQGADLPRLQTTLKCGTSCGSCVPELKRIIKATNEPANQ